MRVVKAGRPAPGSSDTNADGGSLLGAVVWLEEEEGDEGGEEEEEELTPSTSPFFTGLPPSPIILGAEGLLSSSRM